jgi:hypothetical protein
VPERNRWNRTDLLQRVPIVELGQIFLWDPAIRRERWLFDLPDVWDGHPVVVPETRSKDRRGTRLSDGVLRLGEPGYVREEDHLQFVVPTWAYRPDSSDRQYLVEFILRVPTVKPRGPDVDVSEDSSVVISRDVVVLDASGLTREFGYDQLERSLRPYKQWLTRWPDDSLRLLLGVHIVPLRMPADSGLHVTLIDDEKRLEVALPRSPWFDGSRVIP